MLEPSGPNFAPPPSNNWGLICGDPTVATSTLDRLLHHCTPITIKGESYRLNEAKKNKVFYSDEQSFDSPAG